LAYAVAAPIVGHLTEIYSKETLTLWAFVFSSFALLIQGPSRMLGFSDNIGMTVGGFIVLGAMEAFIFVPLMPIIIEDLKS
jgi:MFS family permease